MPVSKSIYATGRRKEASARVFLTPVTGEESASFVINKRAMAEYFSEEPRQREVSEPLNVVERGEKYNISATVSGGGVSGQAAAVVLGLARALEKAEPDLRPTLKKAGLLTRDPRIVERKKPGRHKARKKPQFSKR